MSQADTALLVMDVQSSIAGRFDAPAILEPLKRTIDAARDNGVQVIYVKVAFRLGYPEVSPDNQGFSRISDSGGMLVDEEQVHEDLAPLLGEPEVVKKRVSAFAGSDLEVILRAKGIRTLVLTGIATSGVVLSTLRAAADMDYRLVVLRDCCLDADQEVHRVLLDKVFPRQAEVLESAEWIHRLTG